MIGNHKVYIVVAADEKNGIGKAGQLPWRLKDDMRFFKEVTTKTEDPAKKNMVIMGSKTWISIPKFPLPNRLNVVLTRDKVKAEERSGVHGYSPSCHFESSVEEAFDLADDSIESIFIIGGGQVFAEIMNDPRLDGIYLTRVHAVFDCDVFLPELPKRFAKVQNLGEVEEQRIRFEYLLYQ